MPATGAPRDAEATSRGLLDTFRVLDGVADVLTKILEGNDAHVASASAALHARFEAADAILDTLPGGDMTREVQLAHAAKLMDELETKRALVAKYQEFELFKGGDVDNPEAPRQAAEVPKGPEGDPATTVTDKPSEDLDTDPIALDAPPSATGDGDVTNTNELPDAKAVGDMMLATEATQAPQEQDNVLSDAQGAPETGQNDADDVHGISDLAAAMDGFAEHGGF